MPQPQDGLAIPATFMTPFSSWSIHDRLAQPCLPTFFKAS
jgi:hypothetical protein